MLEATAFVGGIGPSLNSMNLGAFCLAAKENLHTAPSSLLGARAMRGRVGTVMLARANHAPAFDDAPYAGHGQRTVQGLRGKKAAAAGSTAMSARQSSGLDPLVRLLGGFLKLVKGLFALLFARVTGVAARAVGKTAWVQGSARMHNGILRKKGSGGCRGGRGSSSSRGGGSSESKSATRESAAAPTAAQAHTSPPASLSQTFGERRNSGQRPVALGRLDSSAELSLDALLETTYGGIKASLQEAKAMEVVRDCVVQLGDEERSMMSTQWLDGLKPVDMLRYGPVSQTLNPKPSS